MQPFGHGEKLPDGKASVCEPQKLVCARTECCFALEEGGGEPERSRREVLELSNCVNKPLADHGER